MIRLPLTIKRLLSHLPTPLPVGVTQFNTWADSIIELAGPYASPDGMKQAIANMIMHAAPRKGSDEARSSIPKNYFVKGLRKGAANQIASHVFQEIQLKQKAALEALKKAEEDAKNQAVVTAALAEATTPSDQTAQ